MDDLGAATSGSGSTCMLGGGNPARIPLMEQRFREGLERLLRNGDGFERAVGSYDGPQGTPEFIDALAALLRSECGWDVGPSNIALTNGSQFSFFLLFNMFAGECEGGEFRHILLPLTPEYIGYSDSSLGEPLFKAMRPRIDKLDDHTFKYHVNFDELSVDASCGAICISRPTNPTGNVVTDDEIERLLALSAESDIPFIIDSAYGNPFPGIVFSRATPVWNDRTIVTMSLSKLGLPGVRTGIVIAREDIVKAITGMNAIFNLATGSFGPALALDLVRSGEITRLSRDIIAPYYRVRAQQALEWLHAEMQGYPYWVHKPEGAFFLWVWFPALPITSEVLYERLKHRGVLILAGEHFFPGLEDDWPHTHECIRINYSQDEHSVRSGFRIIAEEVRRAFDAAPERLGRSELSA